MPARPSGSLVLRALGALVFFPFYFVYGVVLILRGTVRLVRGAHGVRASMRSTLVCPNGHRSQAVGRWRCAACGGVYHGWVGRCGVCRAGAGTTSCETCGVTIRLPWSRR